MTMKDRLFPTSPTISMMFLPAWPWKTGCSPLAPLSGLWDLRSWRSCFRHRRDTFRDVPSPFRLFPVWTRLFLWRPCYSTSSSLCSFYLPLILKLSFKKIKSAGRIGCFCLSWVLRQMVSLNSLNSVTKNIFHYSKRVEPVTFPLRFLVTSEQ